MRQLSDEQIQMMRSICLDCALAADELTEAINDYNTVMTIFLKRIEKVKNSYDDAVSNMHALVDDLYSEGRDYFDDAPAHWRESSVGQEYKKWIDSMIFIPEVVEECDFDLPQVLDKPNLPNWRKPDFLPAKSPEEK